tara:strand:+ start:1126 stop:1344 length:219 start_codon:yes stop_codon:yes gene_type:complete
MTTIGNYKSMERFKKYFIDDKLMSKKDLCEYLGVSLGKVDLMMSDGLKYFKINRNVRFRKEEVEKYLDSKMV